MEKRHPVAARGLINHNSSPENLTFIDRRNDAPRVSECSNDVKNSQAGVSPILSRRPLFMKGI